MKEYFLSIVVLCMGIDLVIFLYNQIGVGIPRNTTQPHKKKKKKEK